MTDDFEEGLAGLVEDGPEEAVDSGTTTLSPEREEDKGPVMPAVDVNLSEKKDPKAGWPVIMIDEQEGKPNFETVTVNGRCYQIMRGVETPVPPEVLHVLENAIAGRMIQTRNPITGGMDQKMVPYPSIPYRVTKFAQGA